MSKPRAPVYYNMQQRRMTRCHSDDDGMCFDASVCPQLRDGEPAKSGRHCPLDTMPGEDDDTESAPRADGGRDDDEA